VVKVYYMLSAEPDVESMNVTIPKTEEVISKAVMGKSGYKLIMADCWSSGDVICCWEEVKNKNKFWAC